MRWGWRALYVNGMGSSGMGDEMFWGAEMDGLFACGG